MPHTIERAPQTAVARAGAGARWPTLLAFAVVASVFTVAILNLSMRLGKLSAPPTYDDVVYLLNGFDLYDRFLAGGLGSVVWPLLHEHAPLQSLLAAVGYYVFGVHEWSPYAVNGIFVLGLLSAVLWIVRSTARPAQMAILALVLGTPVTANLVAEFRPDLYWGLACGFTTYLMLDQRFLDRHRGYQAFTTVMAAVALLAKPSAVPATAALIGATTVVAAALQSRDLGLRRKEVVARIAWFSLGVAVIAGPYFIINARAIYEYIYTALVTWRDVNAVPGSFGFHAIYYSFGQSYRPALFRTLWIGLAASVLNVSRLIILHQRRDLARYLCYAGIVVLSYLIPTASSMKSYFLGGIFYGTFLLLTAHTLAELLRPGAWRGFQTLPPVASHWIAPALLFAVAIIDFRGQAIGRIEPAHSAELRALASQMREKVFDEARHRQSRGRPTVLFVPSPYPINTHYLLLEARWHGLSVEEPRETSVNWVSSGPYTRTLPDLERQAYDADFIIVSQNTSGNHPGTLLSPALLTDLRNNPDFEIALKFVHANGRMTYLFRRREPRP